VAIASQHSLHIAMDPQREGFVSEMTYYVSSGTLNPTHITQRGGQAELAWVAA